MNPKFITTLQYNKAQILVLEDEYYIPGMRRLPVTYLLNELCHCINLHLRRHT